MASGHVNRIYRPNTWQHRPSLRREKSGHADHVARRPLSGAKRKSYARMEPVPVWTQAVWKRFSYPNNCK